MANMTHIRIPQPAARPLSAREREIARTVATATRTRALEIVAESAAVYRENGMTVSAAALEACGESIRRLLDIDVIGEFRALVSYL